LIELANSSANMPDNEVTSSVGEISNSSGIAMFMGAWTIPAGEGGSNGI
jgi:hypothetical protein